MNYLNGPWFINIPGPDVAWGLRQESRTPPGERASRALCPSRVTPVSAVLQTAQPVHGARDALTTPTLAEFSSQPNESFMDY